MGHIKVLGIKFIVISIITFSSFGIFFHASLMNLFWISLLVTGVSYLIGDLFVLKRYGNLAATLADFPLAFVSFWVLGSLMNGASLGVTTISLLAAFFTSLSEPFIHAYIIEQIADDDVPDDLPTTNQLQTEFAEENQLETRNKDKERDK